MLHELLKSMSQQDRNKLALDAFEKKDYEIIDGIIATEIPVKQTVISRGLEKGYHEAVEYYIQNATYFPMSYRVINAAVETENFEAAEIIVSREIRETIKLFFEYDSVENKRMVSGEFRDFLDKLLGIAVDAESGPFFNFFAEKFKAVPEEKTWRAICKLKSPAKFAEFQVAVRNKGFRTKSRKALRIAIEEESRFAFNKLKTGPEDILYAHEVDVSAQFMVFLLTKFIGIVDLAVYTALADILPSKRISKIFKNYNIAVKPEIRRRMKRIGRGQIY